MIFTIQPIVAKTLAPVLGGAASVWALCLIFFQGAVLGGYFYSFILRRLIPTYWQPILHFFLCGAVMWLSPTELWSIQEDISTPYQLVLLFLIPLGLPLIIISSASSLLASWFQDHVPTPNPKKTFYLYAVSNSACLLALLTYTLVWEGGTPLKDQMNHWITSYRVAIGILMALCLWQQSEMVRKSHRNNSPKILSQTSITTLRFGFIEAMVPSALLCALTSYMSTWTAAAPLIWLLPLSLYLLSFMITFSARVHPEGWLIKLWPTAATLAVVVYVLGHRIPATIALSIHTIAFFLVCVGLHHQLYGSRPKDSVETSSLSLYYLVISLGGFLGSLLVGLIAPQVFNSFFEVPAAYALARILYRPSKQKTHKISIAQQQSIYPLLLYALLTLGVMVIWQDHVRLEWKSWHQILVLIPLVASLAFKKPKTILLAATTYALIFTHIIWQQHTIYHDRSFYASLLVKTRGEGQFHDLINGDIVHGRQDRDNPRTPLSYYHRASGLGLVLQEFGPTYQKVGAVGMGVGTMATYLESGQKISFYEIDPKVIEIAEETNLFTYLEDARNRGVQVDIYEGDGRSLLSSTEETFDILVVDAFQSGSIPIHLLTKEAMDLYMSKINKGGILLIHSSNQHLDFESVFSAHQQPGRYGFTLRTPHMGPGLDPSLWVAFVNSNEVSPPLTWFRENFQPLRQNKALQTWSDQKASLMDVLF